MNREPDNHTNDKVRRLADEACSVLAERGPDEALERVAQGLALAARAHVEVGPQALHRLAQSALAVIERGRWNAMLARLPDLQPPPRGLPGAAVAVLLVRGHCLRRQGRLERAADAYARAGELGHGPGPLHALLELHSAHAQRLLGHYDEALEVYDRLAQAPCPQASLHTVMAAKRSRADVLMLRGQFREALAMVDTLAGAVPDDPLWDSETQRLRAHIQRFNFRLDDAERNYLACLDIAERLGADALRAELLADIAQTRCWVDPVRALSDAVDAIKVNESMGATIEMGKALAGDTESARVAAEVAFGKQGECGYRGGELFALVAKGVALAAEGDASGVGHMIAAMDAISAEHTVYAFASMPLRVWLGPPADGETAWLDADTVARIEKNLKKLEIGGSREGIMAFSETSAGLD